MPTVAHLVQKQVRALPHLEQFVERDLVSFHRLARYLRPSIEEELGKGVDEGAIVMALSRLREKMGGRKEAQQSASGWGDIQLSLRSGAIEIDLERTPSVFRKAQAIQAGLSGSHDEMFSLVQSQAELTLIGSARHEKEFLQHLQGERVLHVERDLALLYLRFPPDLLYQPGFFDRVLRELAWENLNVFEIISTLTELVLVLKEKDAARAYDVLRRTLQEPGAKNAAEPAAGAKKYPPAPAKPASQQKGRI
ncbi:MAG: hypothetical protein KGH63_00075 [Candidatus Micrarchaeota archaeon]|nr:hypothetical protein [Candidatus Micrarchaeota archaeon]